ncbi:DUF1566 domain-containing protein [Patescibacteria group bacterium]|nr:DUF1566 domain-containing protein [Patescibacteria group bacterium]
MTDDGDFDYSSSCGRITFKVGGVTLHSIEASSLNGDGKLYISELAGKNRDNTTDIVVVNILRFLQSIDDDNDPSNGIVIGKTVRDALASSSLDLSDPNVTEAQLQTLLSGIGKTLVSKRKAGMHFEEVLRNDGFDVDTMAPDAPTLTTTPTQSNENTLSVELVGEAQSDVYVNGTQTATIGSTGKENLTLSLAGADGVKSFSITLKDAKGNESEALSFNITKDATAPVFTLADVTVAENQTSAFSVNATDAHNISYALDGLDKASFNISTTGVVTFKEAPDYEEIRERSFIVTVKATDGFGNGHSESLIVNVSNIAEHVPTLQHGLAGSISEDAVAGTLVGGGNIVGVNVTYSGDTAISNIELSGTYASLFELDENLKFKLKTSNSLDFESMGQFIYIDATATNGAGVSNTASYGIEIGNVADVVPTLGTSTLSIDENATRNTIVGDINFTNVGDSALTAITLTGTGSEKFGTSTAGGLVYLKESNSLNYEVVPSYNLTVTATNSAGVSNSATLVINVNDVPELKKTGQTISYDTDGNEVADGTARDDGHYQKGTTPSYTRDDDNETVTDNLTGLMWQDDQVVSSVTKPWVTQANYDAGNYSDTTGDTATTYCDELVMGGHEDWRLPTSVELKGIVDYGKRNPSIDTTKFQNTASSSYWSSTTVLGNEDNAWGVDFYHGNDYWNNKSYSYYVRCVRAGQ